MGNWYANTAHVFLFTYAFKFAKIGGLNQGVIPVITVLATLYNSIIFYFAFGERLSCSKIFGMALIISSVVWLGIDSGVKAAKEKEGQVMEYESKYAFWALGLAMLVPIGFSFKHFLIRKFKGSYDYHDLPLDSCILESLSFIPLTVIYGTEIGYNSVPKFLFGSLAGILQAGGKIFIALAIAEGLAGPTQAIMTTNAVYVTIMTTSVNGQPLTIF